ncbi:hypothetical protein VTI28DRAFT_4479 [Corynascus sepedonium]
MMSRSQCGWSEIPEERFSTDAYHHPNPAKKGCFNAKGGYFLSQNPALFDAPFFSLTRQEAEAMDPQQRLLLECTYEALENAGIPKESLVGSKVGVFIGGAASDYRLGTLRDLDNTPMFDATGVTVDTACSSSLHALHLAVQSIRDGESEQAIVTACHLNLQPDDWVSMSLNHLFSDEGRTYSFDNRAKSGFARGEGAGCLILKPLEQAIRDNDSIRSVILNTGTNQDGRTVGLTSPNCEAQEQLMREVYARAGIQPEDAGFIEAHGTGTKVGDPIEATAIYRVFGQGRTPKQPLYVGSVKSNIGHLENASGIISVIKSSLMLEKGFILPNVNFETPNDQIPMAQWNIKVPTSQRPWPRKRKYISCNNFGFGGSNAHCVLARPDRLSIKPPRVEVFDHARKLQRLFVVSANDEAAAIKSMNRLVVFVEQHPEAFQNTLFRDVAYTLGQRRSHLSWRIGVVASSLSDLSRMFNASDVKPSHASSLPPRVAFVYTGQGAQWHAMGRELSKSHPVFSNILRAADACLLELGADFSLLDELAKEENTSRVDQVHISQPACTAVQLALTALLRSWGIQPVSVTGHSSGEIAAAYAAGALSLEIAMAISYFRGQAVVRLYEIMPTLKLLRAGTAVIACENSPRSVTISGDELAINELVAHMERMKLFHRKLHVDVAYHSPHMKLAAEDYMEFIKDVTKPVSGGSVRFYSSLHGCEVKDLTTLNASYWVDNLVCPVRFSMALRELCSAAEVPDIIVEVGPHGALEGPIKQTLQAISHLSPNPPRYLSTLSRRKDATTTMLSLAASLYMAGQLLEFAAVNGEDNQLIPPSLITDMAPYPWSRQRYWSESRLSQQRRLKPFPRHDLLGTLADSSNHDICPTWRNVLRIDDVPWLRDHQMMGLTTFPLAGYVSMAVEAAAQRAKLRGVSAPERFIMREVQAMHPLLLSDGSEYELVTSMAAYAEGTRSYSSEWDEFRICSWEKNKGWTEHCRGLIGVRRGKEPGNLREGVGAAAPKLRCTEKLLEDRIVPNLFYQELQNKGAIYGPVFRGVRDIRLDSDRTMGFVNVADTTSTMPSAHQSPYILHPTTLDQVLQFAFPLLGAGRGGMKALYMPSAVKELHIGTEVPRQYGQSLHVVCDGPLDFKRDRLRPTDFTLHAFPSSDEKAAAALSIVGLQMSPMRNETANSFTCDIRHKRSALNPIPFAITIVTDRPAEDSLVDALSSTLLTRTGERPKLVDLSSSDLINVKNNACIVLSELDRPLLLDITPENLSKVQTLLLRSAGTLWVTAGAYKSCTKPAANMVSGLLRSVRSETAAKAATLDLEPNSTLCDISRAELILQVLKRIFPSGDGDGNEDVTSDMEYTEQAGSLVVPRIVADDAVNDYIHRELHSSKPSFQPLEAQASRLLRLDIETVGALDTLYFDDAPDYSHDPIGDREIEIRVEATGVNFKDVVIAMGQLPHPGYLGFECAGIVSRVGKDVSHLVHGDRVCAMTKGAYSTFARCAATSAARIPDTMAFEEAASVPVVYSTAYYGLIELARLAAGDKVLIHAAAGGVGQAAIQLAKMVGAEVFATVGSPEKKALIMERYGIPENRIWSSRDTTFGPDIRKATSGVGVDVVLNSLAGDYLRETWECIAPFGRFIEIGKRDIMSNTRLEMAMFDRNVTFSSVDLTLVAAERPVTMARTLNAVMALLTARVLRPIGPITVFGLGEVEKAFRLLQSGKTMGKLVVVSKLGDQIRATHPKLDAPLFRADSTYIIFGGTGGLGRSIARWMVAHGAGNLVLASRSGRTDGAVADLVNNLQRTAPQANVTVKTCDVADTRSVARLVAQCEEELPPIRGCIHAAMVLRDVLFEKMTHYDYSEVVRPKVNGAWNMHTALASAALDFFIVLSSVAGIVGNRGQAAYAAANTSLDALARHRQRLGLPGTSLSLTAVQDVGYLAEDGAGRQAAVTHNLGGGYFLLEIEVLALLKAAVQGKLESGGGHCITGVGLAGNELPYFAADQKFRHLRDAVMTSVDTSASGGIPSLVSIETALARASSEKEAVDIIVAGLAAKLASILMISPESIDSSRSVTEYGLDSLNVIEWRNWITKTLKENFQVLELLAAGSLTNLAASIWKKKAATISGSATYTSSTQVNGLGL